MIKKVITAILITVMVLTLGCTGTDQGAEVQPTPTTSAATAAPAGDAGINITPDTTTPQTEGLTAENESLPELDLPLPPDLEDL